MHREKKSISPIINGVVGFPLSHTWSPKFHELIYKTKKINAVMQAFPQKNIKKMVEYMRAKPLQMLAVTAPHKQAIMKHIDVIDQTAQQIGSINTVINHQGKLYGYNTDIIGIKKALAKTKLKGKNVLVLGAGGSARTVCWFLKKNGAKIFCHNRTRQKSAALMKEFGGTAIAKKWLSVSKSLSPKIDVIINTTPIGMKPHSTTSPLPKKFLQKGQTVFDLVYNPVETQLLKDAKKAGCKTISGITMLSSQALTQVETWLKKMQNYSS